MTLSEVNVVIAIKGIKYAASGIVLYITAKETIPIDNGAN